MNTIKSLFSGKLRTPPKYLNVQNDLMILYLKGLRGLYEREFTFSYGFWNRCLLAVVTLYGCFYVRHQFKPEIMRRPHPNLLVPKSIYISRREHYHYWELSRLARGKPTTFTRYEWDPKSGMIFYTSRDGKQVFEKNHFNRERFDLINNPLFEPLFRKNDFENPILLKKANNLVAYNKTMNNRYDLGNYLQYKPINLSDWLLSVNYLVMTKLKLTNRYRYDEFIGKPDIFYDFEKILIGMNLNSFDSKKITHNYMQVFSFVTDKICSLLE